MRWTKPKIGEVLEPGGEERCGKKGIDASDESFGYRMGLIRRFPNLVRDTQGRSGLCSLPAWTRNRDQKPWPRVKVNLLQC